LRRQVSLAILATVSALTGSMSSARAKEAIQDSFCLQRRQWGYSGNCQFSTYQQCLATASGTDAYCGINPMKALGSSGELGISVATNRSNNRNNQRGRRIGTPFLPERPILTGQQTSDLYAEPGAKVFFLDPQ
jgi:Protein of unknown function (DUF3551)